MAEMKLTKEIIAFRRGCILVENKELVDPRNTEEKSKRILISLLQELKRYGYFLSPETICKMTISEMEDLHKNLLPFIHELYHSGEKFIPLYPGFPEQVISKDESELWLDQKRVYTGNLEGFLRDNPWTTKEEKEIIDKEPDRQLKIMTPIEFMDIPRQMMSAGNSLTQETRDELVWFLETYPELNIPERIPFKETMCIVASLRPEYKIAEVNDVLRYGFYIMGADPSLPHVPKEVCISSWSGRKVKNPVWRNLGTLPRSRRRDICRRLEEIIEAKGVENCIKDAKLFYGHWVLLSERVHPKEYVLNYPECADFFVKLKSKSLSKEYRTFNSQVQNMYDTGKDILDIARFVSSRPGELIRRFDSLLRRALDEGKEPELMDIFIGTSGMKNKTLLEILSYYDKRDRPEDTPRLVNIPGKGTYSLTGLKPINSGYLETIKDNVIRKIMLNIDSRTPEKDLSGELVYIDPEIMKIPIPKGMRTQNISVPKGIRYKLPEGKNIIRFFVHWIQKDTPEDLDLHAFLYKSDNECDDIGWNAYFKKGGAVHSGDVLNRPGNCAEYVDIDLNICRGEGYKYVVMDVCNYKGRGLNTLPVWLGYCSRETLEGNNLTWHPKNVELTIPVTSTSDSIAAMMVDLESREMILLDCDTSGLPVNNRDSYALQKAIVGFFSKPEKYSSYDILKQHYESRGAEVVNSIPDDPEIELYEKVEFTDISKNYIRILDIIGE